MDHRIPRTGTAVSVVLALFALATFLFLNNRFEGPDPTDLLRSPKQLSAEFENTKTLPTKQPVLYRGLSVGRVNAVDWDRERKVAVVTFTLDRDFEVYEDAVLEIGERTMLGDAYLKVASRGSPQRPELGSGDQVARTRPTVNFDEALEFLDPEGRRHVRSMLATVARGTASDAAAERLNATVAGLSRSLEELGDLTRALRGQEEEITGLVSGASTVLSELGRREEAIRTIVGSGRRTLEALAENTDSLERAMVELPRLLRTGRRSLAEARPLLAELRPPARGLRALAPDLARALDPAAPHSLRSLAGQLTAVIAGLPPLRRVAEPVLGEARELMEDLQPLVQSIGPAARNLAPALEYLTPRVDGIAGLYALVAAATQNRDRTGHYLRVGFEFDPAEVFDRPEDADCGPESQHRPGNRGYCNNAYPGPGHALDPQPFQPPYPKLVPCEVPPRSTPRAPCR